MTTSASSTPSESSLASVVHLSGQLDPLLKLGYDQPFSQLHKKYWGIFLNPEDEAGSVKQNSVESSKDDTDESGDADIIPGCSILHFDHPNVPLKRIWIRVSVSISAKITIVLTTLVGRLYSDLRSPKGLLHKDDKLCGCRSGSGNHRTAGHR
jgi:hypothetical protein